MIKNLRYLLLSLLAIMSTAIFAQKTVTIDFDNDYQTLFPTLTGVSSSDSQAGDFTEPTTSTPVDGVMVIVAPAEDAATPSRIWSGSPRLRMYSGAFTVLSTGLPITKIEFNAGSKFNLTPTDGHLSEDGVFTGASMTAVFLVGGNTQIKSIVVTLGEGGTDDPDDPNSPGLLSKFEFTSGTITDNGNQTVFDFAGKAAMGDTGEKMDVSGKMIFDFENEICTACKANVTFPSEIIAALAEMDAKANAEKEGFASVERDGATMTVVSSRDFLGYPRILIKSMLRLLIGAETEGLGILGNPMSPSQANILAGSLNPGEVLDQDVYIQGKIASIKYEFSANYGTATFNISADGKDDFPFLCYSVYYLENKPWVEGNTQIKVGDEVIICGKVTNYNGTPETSSKKAYIYSLNGVTKNEGAETPDPQPQVTTATCAEILAGADGTVYRVTGKCVEIANTTYGNWYLEDATGKVYIYGTLDAEGNTKNFASLGIEVGDEITVEGPRKTYKETVELVDVKVIEIKKGAAEGAQVWDFTKWSDATIANLKADAAASKTSGWSDVEKAADAEAGADPTEASKDNCFWSVAEPNADGTLSANGVVIEELKGLVWNSAYSVKRSLAIAVNYQKALSDYAGPAYLWLGGGKNKIPCFTIPGVKAGSTITMEVESHKASDARGVELYTGVDADNLVDANTKIGDSFTPKEKDTHSWTIDNDCDVIVYNTNGCHIYKIEIATGTGIQAVKTVKADNGFIYNLAGQRVDANYKGVVIKNGQKMIQK